FHWRSRPKKLLAVVPSRMIVVQEPHPRVLPAPLPLPTILSRLLTARFWVQVQSPAGIDTASPSFAWLNATWTLTCEQDAAIVVTVPHGPSLGCCDVVVPVPVRLISHEA